MSRGLSPVLGSLLLVALTVGLAATVSVAVLDTNAAEPAPRAQLSLSADAATDRIAITHQGGDTIPVDALRVKISVASESLSEQPPVPFFAASGFHSGPTGPFNSATDAPWKAGQTAGLRLAATNDPLIGAGDTVTVELYHDDTRIASLETTA